MTCIEQKNLSIENGLPFFPIRFGGKKWVREEMRMPSAMSSMSGPDSGNPARSTHPGDA